MRNSWIVGFASTFVVLVGSHARAADAPVSDEDACFSYLAAGDSARAASVGRRAASARSTRLAHLCLGRAYYGLGELDAALHELKESERLSSTNSDLQVVSNWLGLTYYSMGDLDNAELQHSRSLTLARSAKDRATEPTALNNLASIYSARGHYDKCLKYYREALTLYETDEQKGTAYNNIGVAYLNSGRARESVPWLEKAVAAHERAGAYASVARTRLNLGDTLRTLGSFERAEALLAEGLAATIKLSDQYWQAIAYEYQAKLKRDQKQLDVARDLFAKAAELATRIGAKELARDNRTAYERLLHAEVARTFAGVEIGAKGVKVLAVDLKEPLEGGFTYTARLRKSENTNLLAELQNGAARPAAVEATARAAAGFVRALQSEVGVPSKDIYVLGSSGAATITNRAALAERVKQLAGVNVEFVNARQEGRYALLGAMPRTAWSTGVAVDIGSGNTKVTYSYAQGEKIQFATLDLPFGTVTLTDAVNASRKPNEDFARALDRFVAEQVKPELVRRLKLYPVLTKRNDFYWIGGAVWAFAALSQPADDSTAFVPFKVEDVAKLEQRLRKSPEQALSPGPDADPAANERAQKQLGAVRAAFSNENLLAGTKLLGLLASELHLQKKRSKFSRYGSFLLGYLYAKS
jgi:tetratricopeptide (TPR) repeat protein